MPANTSARRTAKVAVPIFPAQQRAAFFLVLLLFFLWGMSNNLTDILVQQFRKGFNLSQLQAQMVQFAVFFGYFCMALPAAMLMQKRSYRAGVLAGLCLFGCGTLAFWPAASIGTYAPFLAALFLVGCGSAVLETAANPLMAQFGAPETSAQRLNFAQAFNPPGTIAGVLIGTYFIFSGVELTPARIEQLRAQGAYTAYLHNEILRVVPTYIGLGAVVLLLAAVISRVEFPAFPRESAGEHDTGSFRELLRVPHLWMAVAAQFCYCGAQVSTWSAFIPYVKQYTALSERQAGLMLTANLILMAIGRASSTVLMRWFRPSRMMAAYALTNMVLVTAGCTHPGVTGAWMLAASSFFMSVMYPTIFALGVKGLGRNTKLGSALVVMAVIGGGLVPLALGAIARATGSLARGYSVVLLMYAMVAAYGFSQRRDPSVETVDRVPDGI